MNLGPAAPPTYALTPRWGLFVRPSYTWGVGLPILQNKNGVSGFMDGNLYTSRAFTFGARSAALFDAPPPQPRAWAIAASPTRSSTFRPSVPPGSSSASGAPDDETLRFRFLVRDARVGALGRSFAAFARLRRSEAVPLEGSRARGRPHARRDHRCCGRLLSISKRRTLRSHRDREQLPDSPDDAQLDRGERTAHARFRSSPARERAALRVARVLPDPRHATAE